jgi:hypothetical protein
VCITAIRVGSEPALQNIGVCSKRNLGRHRNQAVCISEHFPRGGSMHIHGRPLFCVDPPINQRDVGVNVGRHGDRSTGDQAVLAVRAGRRLVNSEPQRTHLGPPAKLPRHIVGICGAGCLDASTCPVRRPIATAGQITTTPPLTSRNKTCKHASHLIKYSTPLGRQGA